MSFINPEFENVNSQRGYPFAEGCSQTSEEGMQIGAGAIIDAMLYPVSPSGCLWLSGISGDGVLSVSDDTGVIMQGECEGDRAEMHDMTPLGRHCGTILASSEEAMRAFAFSGMASTFRKEASLFSSSCVCPIPSSGVTSVTLGVSREEGNDIRFGGDFSFSNGPSDEVRVSVYSSGGEPSIVFDVIPSVAAESYRPIKEIYCVADGSTPFRIIPYGFSGAPYTDGFDSVCVYLDGIDRESVCSAAHREQGFETADACGCEGCSGSQSSSSGSGSSEPAVFQCVAVRMSADPGTSSFSLVAPDFTGYSNPVSVSISEGKVLPKSGGLEYTVENMSATAGTGITDDSVSDNAVSIQVPGIK